MKIKLYQYFVVIFILWTLAIGFALYRGIQERMAQVEENEKIVADITYKKDIMYRRWVAKQGGVYVRISSHTQPNKYLYHLKKRDVVTNFGDSLTLVNPAYMTRQVFEISNSEYNIPGRIVSLMPINPLNAADEWEKQALLKFEKGDTLITKTDTINGQEYVRHIQPFITEKSCLSCHEQQGYKIGDIRGAISVAVPTTEFKKVMNKYLKDIILNYVCIWLVGFIGIFYSMVKLKKQIDKRSLAEAKIVEQNAELQILNNNLTTINKEYCQLNNEYQKANGELKYNIGEIKMLNENLSEKNKKLDELNATKNKLFSIVAHDLRNPFNALIGFSDLLLENFNQYSDKKRIKMIKHIEITSKESYRLLENILNWARSQSGAIQFAPELFELAPLVDDIMMLQRELATKKGLTIENKIDYSINVFADIDLISTVFHNLISNALKFTKRNGSIEIRAERKEHMVEVFIKDTGIGISGERVKNLFKIDKVSSSSGTEKEQGTGLGLILCKEFVERNNGTISVESEKEKGTTFRFTLPADEKSEFLTKK